MSTTQSSITLTGRTPVPASVLSKEATARPSFPRPPSLTTGKEQPLHPPPPLMPLPSTDVKVILRPRGGLDISLVSPATIANAVLTPTKLPFSHVDQIRPHRIANYILVSTPADDRAKIFATIITLLIRNWPFTVSTHVAAPSDTVTRVIFNIPDEDTHEQVYKSILVET